MRYRMLKNKQADLRQWWKALAPGLVFAGALHVEREYRAWRAGGLR